MGVTPAESHIMEALWTKSPLTLDEISAEVAPAQGWGEATVKTLVHRLLKRSAIRSDRIAGRVRYQPVLQRDDFLRQESQSLLDRLFGGQLAPLVAHFADSKSLSDEDIEHLKRIVDRLDDVR